MSKQRYIHFPVMLAAVVATGTGVVWAVGSAWIITVVAQTSSKSGAHEELIVRVDGKPLIQRYTVEGGSWKHGEYETLDGDIVEPPKSGNVPQLTGIALLPSPHYVQYSTKGWSQRISAFNDLGDPAVYWYFVHDGRTSGAAYFVGYGSKSKVPVRYLSVDGFSEQMPPRDKWFPIDARTIGNTGYYGALGVAHMRSYEPQGWYGTGQSSANLVSEGRLYGIDFRKREMKVMLEDDGIFAVGIPRRALEEVPPEDVEWIQGTLPLVMARSRDQLVLFEPGSDEHRTYKLPDEFRGKGPTFYVMHDWTVLGVMAYQPNEPIARSELIWFDESGEITDRKEVKLQHNNQFQDPATQAGVFSLAMPAPVCVTIMAGILQPMTLLGTGQEPDYASALVASLSYWWPSLFVTFSVAAGLAIAAYRWHRRYALRSAIIWALFVLIGGPPAMLAFLIHRIWPVREECPKCGEMVPRDRDECIDCGAEFPQPVQKGIEVFA